MSRTNDTKPNKRLLFFSGHLFTGQPLLLQFGLKFKSTSLDIQSSEKYWPGQKYQPG
jgi:hypothetical protein